jgi:Ca-activated chloride channel homolog
MKGNLIWLFGFLIVASAKDLGQISPYDGTNTGREIILPVTVSDHKGRVVTGLNRENFEVLLDGVPTQVISCSSQDIPLNIGIVFDTSASAGIFRSPSDGRKIVNELKRCLLEFMSRSHSANRYFLVGFNRQPQLLVDWTSNVGTIGAALSTVQPKGQTAFYDACYLAIEKVQHGPNSKHVLIVLSDALDNKSRYRWKEVSEALKRSDVLFYSINPVFSGSDYTGMETLKELGSLSGGRSFYSGMFFELEATEHLGPAIAEPAMEAIATELRHQYSLAIRMPSVTGKRSLWHATRIQAKPLDSQMKLRVRTRKGFYSGS